LQAQSQSRRSGRTEGEEDEDKVEVDRKVREDDEEGEEPGKNDRRREEDFTGRFDFGIRHLQM
jgi:hypothetical protein